jgi:hypothetical protein
MAVDAVITWVDGADPGHREKLGAYLRSIGGAPLPAARATRFHDAGEIDWCVASILRHAPWIGRIFLVTDAQVPSFVVRNAGTPLAERIRIVDHRELFAGFEQHLPTFNSRSIISTLWRIPGLAEDFIYFNDDFSLLRPVCEQDFFRDGKVVVRGLWRAQSHRRMGRRIVQALKRLRGAQPDRAGNHDAQELSARLAGFADRYYRMFHNPYPMRRSTLQAFFEAHPALFESNLSHRLRSSEQFKTEVLAAHLEIARDSAIFDNALHTVQMKPSEQPAWRVHAKMRRADADPGAAFACLQSLELAPQGLRRDLLAWLRSRVGEPV